MRWLRQTVMTLFPNENEHETAGYSGTPLVKKLGLKEGNQFYVYNSPEEYSRLLGALPDCATQKQRLTKDLDFIHLFTVSKAELDKFIPKAMNSIRRDGMIWVSWPKKSSRVKSDISEDIIRELALAVGLVDVKVCAINSIWSGLKLVIRKELR